MTTVWNIWQQGEGATAEAGGGYYDWTNADLSAELESRGLPKSGTKDELVARLEEDDAS